MKELNLEGYTGVTQGKGKGEAVLKKKQHVQIWRPQKVI